MSLLLDALKKAAEKKAKKSSEDADYSGAVSSQSSDGTETDHLVVGAADQEDQTNSSFDETELNDTGNNIHRAQQTQFDKTEVTSTQLDNTSIEKTELDSTEIESTLPESTDYDKTDIDSTLHEDTAIEKTELDATEVDSTQIESTVLESTELDATEIDNSLLDNSKAVRTGSTSETEPGSTEIDRSESDRADHDRTEFDRTEIDITHIDSTEFKTETLETAQIDQTQTVDADIEEVSDEIFEDENVEFNDSEYEEYSGPLSDKDITQNNTEISEITGEDRTLLFFEEDEDGVEFPSLETTPEDYEAADETERKLPVGSGKGDKPTELTPDDVTEFMGDGLHEDISLRLMDNDVTDGQDDTTVTNAESLSLTQVDFDGLILDKDETRTSTTSVTDSNYYHQIPSADDVAATSSDRDNDYTESDKSTILRSATSISEVDIDQLTNDETVTIKSSTSTRTFAPDNYDRTLLNLSDQDVSKIFPGMKPEAGAVMTPDYAKKVFLSKSGNVKTYYYKLYAGIAFVLLLSVVVWGLFELQSESDLIDNSLARLKRDPMPGIIAPKVNTEAGSLFAKPVEADEKARELLAKSSSSNTTPVIEQPSQTDEVDKALDNTRHNTEMTESAPAEADSQQQANADFQASPVEPMSPMPESTSMVEPETTKVITTQSSVPAKKETISNAGLNQQTNQQTNQRLQVSSSSRMDEKAEILASAYKAYEQGDFTVARARYEEVLQQDSDNRDALLGRAAIHVLDNEFGAAIESYQKLLLANPKDSMAMTSLISVANIEPQVGESRIKTLIRDQPYTDYLHFALGNMYGNQNRWNEAQKAYFEALRFKPQDPNYAYNLAVSLEHLGKPVAASGFYQQALDNTSNGLATFNADLVQQRIEVLSQ